MSITEKAANPLYCVFCGSTFSSDSLMPMAFENCCMGCDAALQSDPLHCLRAMVRGAMQIDGLQRQLTAAIRELEACRNLIHDHADGWGGQAFEALERVEAADVVLKEAKGAAT